MFWKAKAWLKPPPCTPSVPAAAIVAAAVPCIEETGTSAASWASGPVALAMTVPAIPLSTMLSIRSGTVTKAKVPARRTIRGTNRRRSIGEGLSNEVALLAEVLKWSRAEDRNGTAVATLEANVAELAFNSLVMSSVNDMVKEEAPAGGATGPWVNWQQ